MSRTVTLTIDELGARGDGLARTDAGPVFVPYTLAGETVTAIVDGKRAALLSVKEPSADRIEPVCVHFETCGGCALQHMDRAAYRAWKANLIEKALAAHGIDAGCVQPAHFCEPRSRRRAVFSAIRTDKGVLLGFHNNTFARPERLVGFIVEHGKAMRLRSDHRLVISGETNSPAERLKRVRNLVQELVQLAA